jgi:hypothetical protein
MVRRIIPDSEFESDEETQEQEVAPQKGDNGARSPSPSLPPENHPPASTRKLVRGKRSKSEPRVTYEYDSDIYTEDSSMGSFIVYSDEDKHQAEEVVSSGD